jgi:Flp pilus assembly protein TadB
LGALATLSAVAFVCLALSVRNVERPSMRIAHPDAAFLRDRGWSGGLARWESIRVVAGLAATGLTISVHGPLPLAAIAAIAPSVWIRIQADGARSRARRALSRILVAIEAALRSGISLPEALRRGADAASDPLASRPIVAALRAFDLGSSLEAALGASIGASTTAPRAREAMATLQIAIAERLPRERLADLLGSLAERCRFEEQLEDELNARTAGARQQLWLLSGIVPGLALYLAITIPTLAATLGTDLGRFVLVPAAIGLEAAGIVLSRRIVRAAIK